MKRITTQVGEALQWGSSQEIPDLQYSPQKLNKQKVESTWLEGKIAREQRLKDLLSLK